MKECINNLLNRIQSKKIHIDLIDCVKKVEEEAREDNNEMYRLDKTSIRDSLLELSHKNEDTDQAIEVLIGCGFLKRRGAVKGNIYTTKKGIEHSESYHYFKTRPTFIKVMIVLKEYFTVLISFVALLVSIYAAI